MPCVRDGERNPNARLDLTAPLALVARDVHSDDEVEAMRLAGIHLFHRTLSTKPGDGWFDLRHTLGTAREATILPFRKS